MVTLLMMKSTGDLWKVMSDELHEASIGSNTTRACVVEIGSGCASMAICIAQTIPGTTVDTIALSVQQQLLAQKRISALGLSNVGMDDRSSGSPPLTFNHHHRLAPSRLASVSLD
jgi:hypothetical protein